MKRRGMTFDDLEVPKSLMEQARKWRAIMLESVSDYDDHLLQMFLDNQEPSVEGIKMHFGRRRLTAR